MTMGLSYDSHEGRALGGALTAIMTGVAYATSAEMAAELGPFPAYDENADAMLRVIRNHRRAAHGEADGYEFCKSIRCRWTTSTSRRATWASMLVPLGPGPRARRGARLPQRQATVIAPTGTIGLVMDCDTTGIERTSPW